MLFQPCVHNIVTSRLYLTINQPCNKSDSDNAFVVRGDSQAGGVFEHMLHIVHGERGKTVAVT